MNGYQVWWLLCVGISSACLSLHGQVLPPPVGPQGKTHLTKSDIFERFADGKADAQTKSNLPVACKSGSGQANMSFIKVAAPVIHHPKASSLFPTDAQLGQLLTTFLTNLAKDELSRSFTVQLTQLHLLLLHQIYQYLTKIYTVFNMTHIDKVTDYLTQNARQALTKKTLIINHLITIIEAQLNGAVRARFPSLPAHLATYAGTILMKHDYGADFTVMLQDAEKLFFLSGDKATQEEIQGLIKPTVDTVRSSYLNLFADYLRFFRRYTQGLSQATSPQGFVATNQFAQHAALIANIMEKNALPINQNFKDDKAKAEWLRSIQKLNPPLFFYNDETMRGIKLIPALAKSLPKQASNVPWPQEIVNAAKTKKHYKPKFGPESNYPLAYFDSEGRLFVNIPTLSYLYTQELLPQPDWLNSADGVLKMLQACLGDFSRLVDSTLSQEPILDPCLKCVVMNASVQAGIMATADSAICNTCTSFIGTIQKGVEAARRQQGGPVLPPSSPGGIS